MSLAVAIQNYVDKQTELDTRRAEYENLLRVSIPQAQRDLSNAEAEKQAAELTLRRAVTSEEVKNARDVVALKDEDVKILQQLHDNLVESKNAFENARGTLDADASRARREMFLAKRDELMEQFQIPEAEFLLLEMIVAAGSGASDGWGSAYFMTPVGEKYGVMDKERVETVRESILTEMLASIE